MVISSYCNLGFIKCDLDTVQKCEVGSSTTARYNSKYIPGEPISLVERYSGGKLGIAVNSTSASDDSEGLGNNNLILSLNSQEDFFQTEDSSFVFNITYRIYNVKKVIVDNLVEYHILTVTEENNELYSNELYIGPDNIVVIQMSWETSTLETLVGWLTYNTRSANQIQLWDGTAGATTEGVTEGKVTDTNLLWYMYHQNERNRPNGVYNGSYVALQSYSRVRSIDSEHPLNPYVGGIIQKSPSSVMGITSKTGAGSYINSLVNISGRSIAFMLTGQNNISPTGSDSFGRGYVDFCSTGGSEGSEGCTLVYFQLATVEGGCISGSKGLNNTEIIIIVIIVIVVISVISVLLASYLSHLTSRKV